jgi:hypothetical protein
VEISQPFVNRPSFELPMLMRMAFEESGQVVLELSSELHPIEDSAWVGR